MKNNKLVTLLLALLVCFSLVVTVSAASELTIAVEASASTVEYNKTIKVTVEIDENPGNLGVNFDVKWDSNVLELVSAVKSTEAVSDFTLVQRADKAIVTLGDPMLGVTYPQLAPKITGTGKLLELTFKVISDKDTSTAITIARDSYVTLEGTAKDSIRAKTATVKTIASNHKHTPGAAATCTTNQICTHCEVELVAALGHKPGAAATCTTNQTCTVCSIELAPALGHKSATDKAVAPTCTETGLTEGAHCSVCNEVLKKQETVPALGHKSVTDKAVAPTCTETGLTEGAHCSVCNEVLTKQETVPALGHTAGAAATCTTNQTCTVCKVELAPALGHTSVVDAAVAPTCTATGLTEGAHCSVCNEVLTKQETVPALGHKPGAAATCTTSQICTVCAVELAPALGHTSVVDAAVAATCTATGLTEGAHCSVCNEVLTAQVEVAMLPHTPEVLPSVAPTCTETGLTAGTGCSVCKTVLTAQETVEATGHKWGKNLVNTNKKNHWIECKTCGEKKDIKAHTMENGVCTACGYGCKHTGGTATCAEQAVCSVCGKGYGELLAHTPGAAATCTATQNCTVCNAVIAQKLDHDLEFITGQAATCSEAGWGDYEKCKNCDHTTYAEIAATGEHNYGEWTTVTEATTKTTGEQKRTCADCGASESKEIPMLEETANFTWILYVVLGILVVVLIIIIVAKKKKNNG